jgi:glycerol kinase
MHFLARNQYTPLKVETTFSDLILGSIAVAGSAVKWARDQLGIIKTSDEIGKFAGEVDGSSLIFRRLMVDTAGVIFITAFSGLWAPYWRSDVQGTICMLCYFKANR